MSDTKPAEPHNQLEKGTVCFENVRVVITPEAYDHYEVVVSHPTDGQSRYAVERVRINSASVILTDPIWFIGVDLDIGVPVGEPGDTVWVWA